MFGKCQSTISSFLGHSQNSQVSLSSQLKFIMQTNLILKYPTKDPQLQYYLSELKVKNKRNHRLSITNMVKAISSKYNPDFLNTSIRYKYFAINPSFLLILDPFFLQKMQMHTYKNFIDIAQFILHGEEEYVTLKIDHNTQFSQTTNSQTNSHESDDEDSSLHFQRFFIQLSTEQVEETGDFFTKSHNFISEFDCQQSINEFSAGCQEINEEEVMTEQLQSEIEKQETLKIKQQTLGFDLLDVLEKRFEKLIRIPSQTTLENENLPCSTLVSVGQVSQKSEFQRHILSQNINYLFQRRRDKVQRYLNKRKRRNWNKKISYSCRKEVADSRLRVKGRFVTRQQANRLLGINTSEMSMHLIRTLLESKFNKEKDQQTEDSLSK